MYRLSNSISYATSDLGSTKPDLQSIVSGRTQDIFFTRVITYEGNGHATSTDHGILLNDSLAGHEDVSQRPNIPAIHIYS